MQVKTTETQSPPGSSPPTGEADKPANPPPETPPPPEVPATPPTTEAKPAGEADARSVRRAKRERLRYLKRKVEEGKELSAEEQSERRTLSTELAVAPAPLPATPPPAAPGAPQLPPRVSGPPPAPPPLSGASTSRASAVWREKYGGTSQRSNPAEARERVCLTVAQWWEAILRACVRDLRTIEVEPAVNVDKMRDALVLAVDDLLPDTVAISPTTQVLCESTVLVMQRLVHYRRIAAKAAKAVNPALKAAAIVPPPPPQEERAVREPLKLVQRPDSSRLVIPPAVDPLIAALDQVMAEKPKHRVGEPAGPEAVPFGTPPPPGKLVDSAGVDMSKAGLW